MGQTKPLKEILNNKLSSILTEIELDLLISEMKLKSIKKGTVLSKNGQICRQIVFVASGGLRMWQTNQEGKEHTVELFAPGSFALDYYSFITQTASELNIEAVHSSEIFVLEHSRLEELYLSQPIFERISRLLTQQSYLGTIQRFRRDLTLNPQARYDLTMQSRPELFECFPQYMIASYLGVGPEWLSRLRSKKAQSLEILT